MIQNNNKYDVEDIKKQIIPSCTDKCPTSEITFREENNDLHLFEMKQSQIGLNKLSETKEKILAE